ncbi:hypothetical protein PC119_g9737 [Phytophthora cactorum]|nr:hypothetical protein PC119_g9737 [Phytophthora cactorum]
MAATIDERKLLAGVQTGEAPGCTLNDLRMLVQETTIKGVGSGYKTLHDGAVLTLSRNAFGRAIDTCFARKNQLSISVSGGIFLHVARLKTTAIQGISIYKAATHWEQCMLHGFGMLFVGDSDPSSYVFPLVPHAAASDLPTYKKKTDEQAEPPAKRARGRPNVSKYSNDIITLVSERLTKTSDSLPAGLSCHSLRRGSVAYANASPQLVIQWILSRGAWLLDSLTKALAYVGTTTREDQCVGKVLAGYKDPHLPCIIPSVTTLKELLPELEYPQLLTPRGQLFKNVSGFTDASLNVDTAVLNGALAALLIHLKDVAAAVT